MNYGGYITPEEAKKAGNTRSMQELERIARRKGRKCIVCGQPEWKYGGCDMCFSCTTGESDASEDYELIGGKHGKD